MKKTWKAIGAIAVSVPMIAFASCGLQKSDDPAATFATFAEKFTTATAGFAEGNLYLDYYQSVSLSAKGTNGEMSLSSISDNAFDFVDGKLVKCAATANMESLAKVGDTEQKDAIEYSYYLTDGFSYTAMSLTAGGETQESKLKAEVSGEEFEIAIEDLFSFPTDFESAFAGMENIVVESNQSNTLMKITADADAALFAEYLSDASSVLGDYNYDVNATITLTVRFDHAGNLLYVESLMECSLSVAEGANSDVVPTEEEVGGEETPDDGNEEETPATPTDSATVRIYQKATVKNASVVKLPTAEILATYKTQEELNGEVGNE